MIFEIKKLIAKSNDFRGVTSPNPPVAAIAFDSKGNVLGTAFHERAGTEHAESKLLRLLKEKNKLPEIDTLFITLEPCNHTGRTPPCTKAILDARLEVMAFRKNLSFEHSKKNSATENTNYRGESNSFTVIYAQTDPNPNVAGLGARKLIDEGISVIHGFDTYFKLLDPNSPEIIEKANEVQARAIEVLAPFTKWVQSGLPFVTVKIAILDDSDFISVSNDCTLTELEIKNLPFEKMIPPPGSKTFSRPESLTLAHQIRRRSNAIITGMGTVIADLPEFTVRHVKDHIPPLNRELVIMTKHVPQVTGSTLDPNDRRSSTLGAYMTKISQNGYKASFGTHIETELRRLGKNGCLEVLIEAGPKLTKSILDQGLYDEVLVIRVTKGADYVYRYCNPIFSRTNGSR